MSTTSWAVDVPVGYQVGRWRVTAPVASGSWGSVYRAEPAGGGPPAALKFLPTGTVTPRQLGHLREMIEREVRFHRRDTHDRLIRCHEVLTVDDPAHPALDGSVVLVMDLAEGSLADLIRAAGGKPVPGAAKLVEQVCEGLAHMHAQGWVHGDLKPGNVLVMPDGSVRLGDFGLAAELEGTHAYVPPMGSSDYVPPERSSERLGERGLAVRPSADIWALGVTACQLLTGRHPRVGGQVVVPADLPPGWRPLIEDCLAPTHAARQRHTAAALLSRIRALPFSGRRRRLAPVAVVAALVVAAGALTAFVAPRLAREPAPQPAAEHRPDLLRTGVGIPPQYRELIVAAGTACDAPGLSPALVAAMLKVESNFDPDLSDPAKDEYGIARWTPRVLVHYLPEIQRSAIPKPPFPPEMSIPAVGRYLCYLSASLAKVPGDPALLLAAAYRTSSTTVVKAGGVPASLAPHTGQVAHYLALYRP